MQQQGANLMSVSDVRCFPPRGHGKNQLGLVKLLFSYHSPSCARQRMIPQFGSESKGSLATLTQDGCDA